MKKNEVFRDVISLRKYFFYDKFFTIMKLILKFAGCILLTGSVFFVACNKETPVDPVVLTPHVLQGGGLSTVHYILLIQFQ